MKWPLLSLSLVALGGLLSACDQPVTSNAPVVQLTGTLSGTQPGVVNLSATVKSSAGIQKVVFSRENVLLGSDDTASGSGAYEFSDVLPASGKYRYRALATDANGLKGEGVADVTIDIPAGLSEVRGTVVESAGLNAGGLTTSAWTGGSGSLMATVSSSEVARTSLNSAGQFVLTLPGSLPATSLQAFAPALFDLSSCLGAPTANNPSARGALAAVRAEAGNLSKAGAVRPLTITTTQAGGVPKIWTATSSLLVYLNQPVTLSGMSTCTLGSSQLASGSGPVTFNLALVPGWNRVSSQLSVNTSGNLNLELSSEANSVANWVYGAPTVVPPTP